MKRLILILAGLLLPLTAIGDNILLPIVDEGEVNRDSPVIVSGNHIPSFINDYLYRKNIDDFSKQFANLRDGAVLHVDTSGSDETGDGSEANPFATIQNAINISLEYDTVLVHPGTYHENIIFGGHNTIVSSLAPITGDSSYALSTIIDGGSSGSVLSFYNDENLRATITGFTIRNGSADSGGGIFVLNSNPTISNNYIVENTGNYFGGGIYCGDTSCPNIIDNVIKNNFAGYGGAICCRDSSAAYIQNNELINNDAFYGGGGLYCYYSDDTLINNTIAANEAGYYGGGIALICSRITLRNCVVVNNEATYDSQIFGNSYLSYYNLIAFGPGAEGLIFDPLFLDTAGGNYNSCIQSPLVDRGDPNVLDPDSSRSDIGRYYPYHPTCDYGRIWYVSTSGDDSIGDGTSGNPLRTVQNAIYLANSLDSVIVDTGIYYENLVVWYENILLASNYIFSGNSIDIQNTIIDGDSAGTVVTFEYCSQATVLSGFTLRNGYENMGAGIICDYSDPVISNNAIVENIAGNHGGGIYLINSNPHIINCTVSRNVAAHIAGGLLCENSSPLIENSIFWGDLSDLGYEIFSFPDTPYTYCCNIQSGWPGDGNIDADPEFINPDNGNYFIHASSPCAPANNSCNILIGAFDVAMELTNINDDNEIHPHQYCLGQNYPNPFNPSTVIEYHIPARAHVDLVVYNLLGRKVKTLVNEVQDAGSHSIVWNGIDTKGVEVATGVYLYRITVEDYVNSRKMLLVK